MVVCSQRPEIEEMIAVALEKGGAFSTASHVLYACSMAEMQLWLIAEKETGDVKAVCCTECRSHPTRPLVMHMQILAGAGIDQWADVYFDLERWAIKQGCTDIEGICVPGLTKKAKAVGFRTAAYVLRKQLTQERPNGSGTNYH